ncbi:MAG: tetratricopeptide repeat protein [Bradyrhizobium sp.]|uniref:DUF4062 domain-containing protein n=1 Tax=Bradyrhizobium sp. TaxID=376 RepID=UPI003D14B534
MKWQSRPIFVSSTFNDMQAERDFLRTHVFPALEERLKRRRQHLEWVDLRVGVATAGEASAQARELQILKVCLTEIKRCRPFLIVLVGDRYGWIPPAERIMTAAREEGFEGDVVGRSVTDLEVRYGVFDALDDRPRSFFYFRDLAPIADMPRELASVYSDAGDAERMAGLANLKRDILRNVPERVRRYSAAWDSVAQKVVGLEAWGQQVIADLWSELEDVTAADVEAEPTSWQNAERIALEDYITDRTRDFVGRKRMLDNLQKLAMSPPGDCQPWAHCLIGQAGTGKSAVLGQLYRRLQGAGSFVLMHAASASPRSHSVEDMLRRWSEELAAGLGLEVDAADSVPDTIERTFHSLLERMAAERHVVVLIDALDQFEATVRARSLAWLPRQWPRNARLIATAIPCDASMALIAREGASHESMPQLDKEEALGIVEAICARYHRALEPEVVEALLARNGAEGPAWAAPLWLVLATEELNLVDADDLARSRRYEGEPAEQLRSMMLDIVAALPTDTVGLYTATFDRSEALFGRQFTTAFLRLIAISRGGWRENDFKVLLPRMVAQLHGPDATIQPWDELQFASLRRLFRGQVRQRGKIGQWDFNHGQMRVAVRARAGGLQVPEQRFHAEVATHLLSLEPDDPLRVTETMLHLVESEDWERAAAHYGNPHLTEDEVSGCTQVIADRVLSAEAGTDRLSHVHQLLDAPQRGTADRQESNAGWLARELLLRLDAALDQRVDIETRTRLIAATGEKIHQLVAGGESWLLRDLGAALLKAGEVQAARGLLPAALISYRAALDTSKQFEGLLVGTDAPFADSIQKSQVDGGLSLCRFDQSIAHERIGDVLNDQGDLPGALKSYEAKRMVMAALTATDPTEAEWRRDLSVAHERIGSIHAAQGDLPEALASFETSLAIREALNKEQPDIVLWQSDLSISYGLIGETQLALGAVALARSSYESALNFADRAAKSDPLNVKLQHFLGISLERFGDLSHMEGDFKEALKAYLAKQDINERLADADPNNVRWIREAAVAYTKTGDVLQKLNDFAGAVSCLARALDIFAHLARLDSLNTAWQRDLYGTHIRVGDALKAQGDLNEAHKHYRIGHDGLERLVQQAPGIIEWAHDLAVAKGRIGDVLADQGDIDGALQEFVAKRDILVSHSEAFSRNTNWQDLLHETEISIGDILQARGNPIEALVCYRNALDNLGELADTDPGNGKWQLERARVLDKVGPLQQVVGDLEGALVTYRASLAIGESRAETPPEEQERQIWLHQRIGDACLLQADVAAAQSSYRAMLRLSRQLVESDQDNATFRHDLFVSHSKLGDLFAALGSADDALANYQAALGIARSLAEDDAADIGRQRDIMVILSNIGSCLGGAGRIEEALDNHRSAHGISKRLARDHPMDRDLQHDLAVSYERLGRFMIEQAERPADGLLMYNASRAQRERISRGQPADFHAQGELSRIHILVGNAQRDAGNLSAALEGYRKALGTAQILAEAEPDVAAWRLRVMEIYINIIIVVTKQGKLDEAHAVCCAYIDVANSLLEAEPGNVEHLFCLAVGQGNYSRTLERMGHWQAAHAVMHEACEIARRLETIPEQSLRATDLLGSFELDLERLETRLQGA